MFQLEKYKGTKSRHTCPNCGGKLQFARYINHENGNYLGEEVGKCNRDSKCGYHFTPRMFFDANPELSAKTGRKQFDKQNRRPFIKPVYSEKPPLKKPDYIPSDELQKTLSNYEQNAFVRFLLDLFPEDTEIVIETVRKYLVGTFERKTVFWQIDRNKRIRTGKVISYDAETGKRIKTTAPGWIHAELKKQNLLPDDFNLSQCFFGEHLLIDETVKPMAIVEAEKTACLASICFPDFIWLACGSKQNLKAEKLLNYRYRKIVLYPDADGFERWQSVAHAAHELGLSVKVSNLIESYATREQKENGFDLADYLTAEQTRINRHNEFADNYNARVDFILNDDEFLEAFNTIIDERKSIMVIDGHRSEEQAEEHVLNFDNVRSIVLSL